MGQQNWRTPQNFPDLLGSIQKRIGALERREGSVSTIVSIMGPAQNKRAVLITDWSDEIASNNGYFWSRPGALHSPNPLLHWTGSVIGRSDNSGMQEVWNTDDLDNVLYYMRTYVDDGTGQGRIYSTWRSFATPSGMIELPNLGDTVRDLLDEMAAAIDAAPSTLNVYSQATAPTNPDTGGRPLEVGDTWFDTDDDNHIYIWNGTAWVDAASALLATLETEVAAAQDAAEAAANAASDAMDFALTLTKTYRQAAPPTNPDPDGRALVLGDVWFDTDDENRMYQWTGAWTLLGIETTTGAQAKATAAQAAAIAAAAADATTKAGNAQSAAISTAAADATTKAANAQAAAIAAAATDATTKANSAQTAAIAAAAADATTKAGNAQSAAISTAAADATTKAANAQSAAIAAATLADNKINNPTRTGTTTGWSVNSAGALAVETVDFNGANVRAVKYSATESVQAYTNTFPVDASKAYQLRFWVKDPVDVAGAGQVQQFYVGTDQYRADGGSINILPVPRDTGVAGAPSGNFYFGYVVGAQAGWTEWACYVFPVGAATTDMQGLGGGSSAAVSGGRMNAKMSPETTQMRFRFLNWDNASGVNRDLWIYNPVVTELSLDDVRAASLVQQWQFTGTVKMDGGDIQADTVTAAQVAADAITAKHSITGALYQTTATAARGIKITSAGLTAYTDGTISGGPAAGTAMLAIDANTGSITMRGDLTSGSSVTGAVVTGGTVQSEATAARGIKITSGGLTAYNGSGVAQFTVDAATGSLTLAGALTGAGTITGPVYQTTATASRGVKISSTGLTAYTDGTIVGGPAAGTAMLVINGTTGAITMRGDLTSGSSVTGAVVTGGTVQSEATAARGVKITSGGLTAYDAAGTPTFTITAATGAVSMKGDLTSGSTVTGATVTGGTLQSEATALRGIKMTSTGLIAYDSGGFIKLQFDVATGVLGLSGAIDASTITGSTVTGGTLQSEATAARGIKINSSGLTAYNGSGVAQFTITASTGALVLTGPLTGGGTITGPVFQTSASANTGIKISSGGLIGYDGTTAKFTLDAATGILALTGGVLANGSLTGAIVTGGTLQSEATAARGIKINSAGLVAYNTSGVAQVTIDASTGSLVLAGTMTGAGTITGPSFQTAASGERLVISSGLTSQLSVYTGLSREVTPGGLEIDGTTLGTQQTGYVRLTSPKITVDGTGGGLGRQALMEMWSAADSGTLTYSSRITVTAGTFVFQDVAGGSNASVSVGGHLTVSGSGWLYGGIGIAYASGWSTYSVSYRTPRAKRIGEKVYLAGTALRGVGAGAVMFTLPADMRPDKIVYGRLRYFNGSAPVAGTFSVDTAGNVTVEPTTTNTTYSFDGAFFDLV